jgi:hypothetical protein
MPGMEKSNEISTQLMVQIYELKHQLQDHMWGKGSMVKKGLISDLLHALPTLCHQSDAAHGILLPLLSNLCQTSSHPCTLL